MIKSAVNFFVLGIVFGSGPCLASCGPLLISYSAAKSKGIAGSVRTYLLFSSGRIFIYTSLGFLIYFLGKFAAEKILAEISRYVFVLGGIFIVFMGALLALEKKVEYGLLKQAKVRLLEHDKKSVIFLGLIVGLLPCAPLLVVLFYAGLISKNCLYVLLNCFSFGLGTILSPLLLLVVIAGIIPKYLKKVKESYCRIFTVFCGLILIILGIHLIISAWSINYHA